MIAYADALKIIQSLTLAPSTKRLPLIQCLGLTLAEDVSALVPSPPYTNSAMDGFAVRRDEAASGPLEVIATIYARAMRAEDMPVAAPGACVRIMTGGALPEWADTVIPVEQSVETGEPGRRKVTFKDVPPVGTNIRIKGSDLEAGSLVLKCGTLLDPERLGVAAAFGHKDLLVTEKPRLVFIATGDELVEPGEELPLGAVYNSSKYFLLAAARSLGFGETPHLTVPDDEDAAARLIQDLLADGRPTVLVTTGAVSAGDLDFIPRVGAKLGFAALFHRVAIRPGKPVYLAAKTGAIWLGLPGNPVSTMVGWHAFAHPLLATVAGVAHPVKRTLLLKNEVRKPENLRCFFRAEVNGDKAWVGRRQGSAELTASICNEAYVELPEGFARIPADTRVEAIIV